MNDYMSGLFGGQAGFQNLLAQLGYQYQMPQQQQPMPQPVVRPSSPLPAAAQPQPYNSNVDVSNLLWKANGSRFYTAPPKPGEDMSGGTFYKLLGPSSQMAQIFNRTSAGNPFILPSKVNRLPKMQVANPYLSQQPTQQIPLAPAKPAYIPYTVTTGEYRAANPNGVPGMGANTGTAPWWASHGLIG